LNNVNINTIQYIAIIASIILFGFILYLVRSKKIKIEYSLLWLFFSFVFVLISFWRDGLNVISFSIGIAYPPIAFLLILVISIFLILIQFSVVISKQKEINKNLSQEVALLKNIIENTKKKND
jgi:hypothetical protein